MLADTQSFTQFWSQQENSAASKAGSPGRGANRASVVVRSATMETLMGDQVAFRRAARDIVHGVQSQRRLGQQGVRRLFFESGFLSMLAGGQQDVMMDNCLDGDGQADVCVQSFTGRPIALFEFTRAGDDLGQYTAQLEMDARRVLGRSLGLVICSNGIELWLYRMREGRMCRPATEFNLANLSSNHIRAMLNFFQHCQVAWPRHVRSPQLW